MRVSIEVIDMRAAIYIRVSTEEQSNEGFSIDAQKTLLMKKVEEYGYTFYDFYIDDGYSAKNMNRPALKRLISDVRNKAFDVVLFWRLDRFTRRSADFHKIIETLTQHNAGIKSATEPIDTTTAIGRFQLELSVLLGQLERETTAERVHFVMEDRHRKGHRQGAPAPLGYDMVNGELIINPVEAEVVKRIFKMYKENYGALAIAKQFNREGVPFIAKWNYSTVYYIVTNPVYCGKIRWNYRKGRGERTGREILVDGNHEPIITEEEYEYIQHLRERRAREGKKASSDYPFTGVLRCARCGYGMIGSSRPLKEGRRRYYKCLGRFNYGSCDMPIIQESSVTDAFLNKLDFDKNDVDLFFHMDEAAATSDSESMVDQLRSELDAIQKRKKKWQEAYANDVISLDDLKERTEEDRQREEYIKSQLSSEPRKEKSYWTKDEIIQQLKELREAWHLIDNEAAKKNFINDAFDNIIIDTYDDDIKGGPGRRVEAIITSMEFKI
jgi:site-specific DNA recombinase